MDKSTLLIIPFLIVSLVFPINQKFAAKNFNRLASFKFESKTLTNTISTLRVPAGTAILQGRAVTLTRDFYLGRTEITYAQWDEVKRWGSDEKRGNCKYEGISNPYHGLIGSKNSGSGQQPVTNISWQEVIIWCNALSEKEGLLPVYCSDKEYHPIRTIMAVTVSNLDRFIEEGGNDNPVINSAANGYRLPTEAEWEYAARYIDGKTWTPENYLSGASADYTNKAACEAVAVYYNRINDPLTGQWITPIIRFDIFNDPHTSRVAKKKANALGLYDMSGNVSEWCWDWTAEIEIEKPTVDPRGPDKGEARIVKGGSYNLRSDACRVSARSCLAPYFLRNYIGFRVARNGNIE